MLHRVRGVISLVDELRRSRALPPAPPLARAIRERAGVTQARLARELGVDQTTVSRYELGLRTARGRLAERYAEVLRQLLESSDASRA